MIPKTLKGFQVFIDGVGYAGKVEEGAPPPIELRTEEVDNGGLAGTVDVFMGQVAKMEFEITLSEINPDVSKLIGRSDVPIAFRGAIGNETSGITTVLIDTRCLVKKSEIGAFKAGEKGTQKFTLTANYYKETIDGTETVEIDVQNMLFKSGGVDHMADIRSALGFAGTAA